MSETAANGNRTALGLLALILLAAAAVRVWSASGDLWLDEVWSLYNIDLARALPTAGTWVALLFHTNTHPLNTLYLALVGPDAGPFAYRGLSVAAGIGTVAAAAAMGWRRGPAEGLIAAAMVAVSYPMVHYSGEARGYAPMLLAALAAPTLLETYLDAPTRGRAAAFVAVSLLGLASHLSFVVIEAGLGVWAAAVLYRGTRSVVSTLARLVVLFGVQAVALAAFGAVAVGNLASAANSPPSAAGVGVMADLAFGADPSARGSVTLALALALGWAIWELRRRGDGAWIFFFIVVLVFPLGFVLLDPPIDTSPRYFLASALIALIAGARGLAMLWAGGRWTRALAGAALALFFIGNGLLLDKFFAAGRGSYGDAVRFIAAAGEGPARVAGYQPLRVGVMLDYHASRTGLADAVRFVPAADDARDPAPWFIDGSFAGGGRPPARIFRRLGDTEPAAYTLEAVYPRWGLSGDTWAVYRRRG